MASHPVAILFLLKNAPNCTSEHLYFQKFSGGACPQTPLGSAAFAAGVGFTTKRTTLEDFLDPPLLTETVMQQVYTFNDIHSILI